MIAFEDIPFCGKDTIIKTISTLKKPLGYPKKWMILQLKGVPIAEISSCWMDLVFQWWLWGAFDSYVESMAETSSCWIDRSDFDRIQPLSPVAPGHPTPQLRFWKEIVHQWYQAASPLSLQG